MKNKHLRPATLYPVPQNAPHVSAGMNVVRCPEGQRPKATDVSTWYGVYAWLAVLVFLVPATLKAESADQEWAKLIAAAQREGRMVIAAGGSPSRTYRPITDVFQKKYGIKVEISSGNATSTTNRVLAERRARRYTVDVALISVRVNNQRLVPSNSLVPFRPLLIHPEVVDKSKWYQGQHWYGDKALKYTFIYHAKQENKYDFWYNTKKISKEEIATIQKQWDFFDPRWKGKSAGQAMGDPAGIRSMVDAYFEPDRGPKWVQTYLLEAGITFSDNRRILETWLVGGRFPLQPLPSNSRELTMLARKGLPVKRVWLPKQRSVLEAATSGCCISVFTNAPHPNAAKLFVNWFVSKEGQTLTHTKIPFLERMSLRNDIPFGEVTPDQRRKPDVKYRFPDAEPGFGAEQEKVQKWVMKIWESRQR